MDAKDSSVLSAQEIATHRSTSSCWIVVGGKVYDVTSYLDEHPGGAAVLLTQGGTDATAEFRKIHSPDILKYLPKDAYLGSIDVATRDALPISSAGVESTGGLEAEGGASEIPHISSIVVPNDFEAAAKAAMPLKSWTYVSSSAHDGSALRANLASWHAVRFRPRIFHDVSTVDARTSILGSPSAFPFYVSPMGQLGRSHSTAEIGVVRALARRCVHGVLSAESTVKLEEIAAAFLEEKKKVLAEKSADAQNSRPEAQLHFQLYVPADRAIAVQRIRRARATGAFRSLWVTVDTPVLGKRTADRKLQAAEALATSPELAAHAERAGFGMLSHAGPSLFNSSLTWDDVAWIKREWGGPVVLKGVQTAEDAARAADLGLEGVLLSNHGGRQMHGALDALTTLLEIREYYPGLVDRIEVFVDGGCRDGADVLKAVALGARAVGVGRPFFYALATYGEKGVERCADIYADELVTGMKLVGMKNLKEATPERVNASRLLNEIWRPEKSRL